MRSIPFALNLMKRKFPTEDPEKTNRAEIVDRWQHFRLFSNWKDAE